MSLSKYMVIGAGALAVGAGILYLSKEPEQQKIDPKVHTVEKLLDVLDDLYLEYTTSYIYLYSIIAGMKEQNQITPEVIETAKTRLDNLTRHNDEDVSKRNNITAEFLQ